MATICSCRELLFSCSFDTALVTLQKARSSVSPSILISEASHILAKYKAVLIRRSNVGSPTLTATPSNFKLTNNDGEQSKQNMSNDYVSERSEGKEHYTIMQIQQKHISTLQSSSHELLDLALQSEAMYRREWIVRTRLNNLIVSCQQFMVQPWQKDEKGEISNTMDKIPVTISVDVENRIAQTQAKEEELIEARLTTEDTETNADYFEKLNHFFNEHERKIARLTECERGAKVINRKDNVPLDNPDRRHGQADTASSNQQGLKKEPNTSGNSSIHLKVLHQRQLRIIADVFGLGQYTRTNQQTHSSFCNTTTLNVAVHDEALAPETTSTNPGKYLDCDFVDNECHEEKLQDERGKKSTTLKANSVVDINEDFNAEHFEAIFPGESLADVLHGILTNQRLKQLRNRKSDVNRELPILFRSTLWKILLGYLPCFEIQNRHVFQNEEDHSWNLSWPETVRDKRTAYYTMLEWKGIRQLTLEKMADKEVIDNYIIPNCDKKLFRQVRNLKTLSIKSVACSFLIY